MHINILLHTQTNQGPSRTIMIDIYRRTSAPGDIVVYDSNTGGGAGHVSIVYLNPLLHSGFTGFDQNWSTPGKCNIESHTYNHALGFS